MKPVVMIPTYNEGKNIGALIDRIESLQVQNLQVIVVDDDSPDGTWRIVQDCINRNPKIHLLRRLENRGRGLAGVAGFKYALEIGADCVIEMDGDFSHNPAYIPEFLKAIRGSDVVLGSRFVKGGGSRGRSVWRKFVSRLASSYIRLALGLAVKDPTSGFRCFRSEVLEKIGVGGLTAKGPFIVTEILFRCHREGFVITEIPIFFEERASGSSKLGFKTLVSNLFHVLRLRFSK